MFIIVDRAIRFCELLVTKLRWSWRFQSIGSRSVLRKCRLAANPKSVSVGQHTIISDNWCLVDLQPSKKSHKPKIRIGSHCTILYDFHCNASLSVEIQDYVLIAPRVFVTDSDHIVDERENTTSRRDFRSAPVVIEHNCWIGVNAVILKGVTIGHHSIIAANAVVTRDVPPHSVVAGVPARVVGEAKDKDAILPLQMVSTSSETWNR